MQWLTGAANRPSTDVLRERGVGRRRKEEGEEEEKEDQVPASRFSSH